MAVEWRRRRQATIEEIKATARRQIAKEGAANFSFGAVARAMGMTPPALYRYFNSRDALIVALIIDAYDSMGQALERAVEELPPESYAARFLALMHACRGWAVDASGAYALMHGASMADVEMSEEHAQASQCAVMHSMGASPRAARCIRCRPLDRPAPIS
jgi:AcrR family transcriptional regulator